MRYLLRVGAKIELIGNFEKIFENFEKISKENCKKCIIFAYFSINLTNHALLFSAFGRKTKSWKMLRKFSKIFLRKLLKCIILAYFFKKFN